MDSTPLRVLWLSNSAMSDGDPAATGTWLHSMSRSLLETKKVELGNIAFGPVTKVTSRDSTQVKQWLVPAKYKLRSDGLPARDLLDDILAACRSFDPDIVNVWGTESFWGLLPARGLITTPSVLTLQGIRYAIAPHFYGTLRMSERFAIFGPRELARFITLRSQSKRFFERWGCFEKEIMAGHRWAICQTPWQEAQMVSNRQNPTLFHLDLPFRKPFEQSEGWKSPAGEPRIFCCASHWEPAKGLHVALRAASLLKRRCPGLQLRIGGAQGPLGPFGDRHSSWLLRQVIDLGLTPNVRWLGPLNASGIVNELVAASATVIPTFIESYCMAFAESMMIGTPAVVSYTGGTAYLGKDEHTCLFFPPGDDAMCAYQLQRLISNPELSKRLSSNSREIAARRHCAKEIAQRQLDIYRQVLSESPAKIV